MARLKPNELDAWQAAGLMARRELTAVELMQSCLDRVDLREPEVSAFASRVDADTLLAQARALDAGPLRGPLHGLPLGVKDLFDSADLPTTYGSALYAGHRPRADAAALALCREAGALMLGKTVSTEFAYFTPGLTRNPHALGHTPGGSSSGSAAAVADHMVPLALGTQTAGSIIRPAAYCGVVGYKPSHDRVPRGGVKSLSETLDVIGGFGRSVRDAALLGSVLLGDNRLADEALFDATRLPAPRIGLCLTPDWSAADADTQAAMDLARRALAPRVAALTDIDLHAFLPADAQDLVSLQKAVMDVEMTRSLSHERIQHGQQLSERLRALFAEGGAISGADHAANLARTQRARSGVDALFDQVDAVLAPSSTGVAPAGTSATGDPLFCRGWTLMGLPCVHLPFTQGQGGLPVGLQLVGRRGDDLRLLAQAHWCFERLKG
jgi:Asp-tRNA(Asn)/Glu-tRNA(Gln) amidotransferase A subunit family amidase